MPLGLPAGIQAADAAIQNKIYELVCSSDLALLTKALIILNEEM